MRTATRAASQVYPLLAHLITAIIRSSVAYSLRHLLFIVEQKGKKKHSCEFGRCKLIPCWEEDASFMMQYCAASSFSKGGI